MNSAELAKTALSEQAYKSLRTAILTGRIPFGSQLVVKDLCDFIGFSATPIKQALTSLEREGLVILIPYRGFFVPSFDAQDVLELYEVREALERRAARNASKFATETDLDLLENILLAQIKSAREGNTETHIDLDLQFHDTLARLSKNERLVDQTHSVLGQAQLLIASSSLSIKRFQTVHHEHAEILAALRSKNPDAAELAIWQHLQNAREALCTYYEGAIDNSDRLLLSSELESLKSTDKPKLSQNVLTLEQILTDREKNRLRDALAKHIGPMAIFASSEVLRKTSDLSDALEHLASRIPNPEDAQEFKLTMLRELK